MDEIRVGDQTVRFDRELTRQAYSLIKRGGADECGCSYCRNFSVQRSTVYPASFLSILDRLGIDPDKEDEVYELGPAGGLLLYGGWLFFAGELVKAGERRKNESGSEFQNHFTDARMLPKPSVDFGEHVLAVDFLTKLPWIIDGEP